MTSLDSYAFSGHLFLKLKRIKIKNPGHNAAKIGGISLEGVLAGVSAIKSTELSSRNLILTESVFHRLSEMRAEREHILGALIDRI